MLLFIHSLEYTSHKLVYIPRYVAYVYKECPEIKFYHEKNMNPRCYIQGIHLNVGSDVSRTYRLMPLNA